jgi:hypothetical protein
VITKEEPTPNVLVNKVDKYMVALVMVEHANVLVVNEVTVIDGPDKVDPVNCVV